MKFLIGGHKQFPMRKTFNGELWESYPQAKHFKFSPFDCDTMNNVFDMLVGLQSMPNTFLVRGEFIGDTSKNEQYQSCRLKVVDEEGNLPTIQDVPLDWAMLDIDGYKLPKGIVEDEVPEYILETKLSFLGDVDCVFQHSSKSGVNGFASAKCHVFIQLNKGYLGTDLERWAILPEIKVDPAPFRVPQVHYIQTPLFQNSTDPIKQRIVRIHGTQKTYTPTIPPVPVFVPLTSGNYVSKGPEPWLEKVRLIEQTGAHPYIHSAACSYWTCRGCECDWNYFENLIVDQMRAVQHPRAGEGKKLSKEIADIVKQVTRKPRVEQVAKRADNALARLQLALDNKQKPTSRDIKRTILKK